MILAGPQIWSPSPIADQRILTAPTSLRVGEIPLLGLSEFVVFRRRLITSKALIKLGYPLLSPVCSGAACEISLFLAGRAITRQAASVDTAGAVALATETRAARW